MISKRILSKICIVLWCGFLGWSVFVCYLSSLSADRLPSFPDTFVGFDKILHCLLFFIGGVLLTAAFRVSLISSWLVVLLISIVTLAMFGLGDEIHQLFTHGRTGGDFWDWAADLIGVTLGAMLIVSISRSVLFLRQADVSTESWKP